MIDPKATPDVQLIDAKKLLKLAEGHWSDAYDEMRESVRFRHNTDSTGQWAAADVNILKQQGRPVLTMNIVAHKIESVVGMHEENRKCFTAQAVGDEDRATADLVNAVLASIGSETSQSEIERESFERQMTIGECDIALSTSRDSENPSWLAIKLSPILPTDIAWDPAAERRDASDARYFFWSRWMTKQEFIAEYPEKTDEVNQLFSEEGNGMGLPGADSDVQDGNDYQHRREGRLGDFIDRKRGELRVVHMECRYPARVKKAQTEIGVQVVDDATAEMFGMTGVPVFEVWEDTYYWLEFANEFVLFSGVSPEPFKGFTVKRAQCYRDDDTGYPYGIVRNLRDPQRNVNKATTMGIEHIVNQSKPGWIAEQGAIPDVKKFDDANATGQTTIVASGALAGGAIQARTVPIYSDAAAKHLDFSMGLLDKISGIYMDAESPVRGQEAATTVLLRDRKALRSMVQPMRNFERMQQELAWAILEIVATTMPTDQILSLAGDSNRWQVDPAGQIIDTERQVPVNIRTLRQLKLDLEPESVDASEMKSVHELSLLMQLVTVQIPVEPEVIYSRLPVSRAEKESLKNYARKLEEGQAQAAQQQQQMAEQQLTSEANRKDAEVQVKAASQQETARHNQTDEKLDLVVELLKIISQGETAQLQARVAAAKQAQSQLSGAA